ncbi:hypothetical protein B5X24_HaOG203175 [Helicoverpa armigera]|uniref:Uncharacterized protein n=1 Tax=Helicoverpa armigera TaxID=29058 RepID=A0A2W1BR22_HELAM|nr:hypothetical protein B5X24_HaOG203175 [Helicoverpa armigera]
MKISYFILFGIVTITNGKPAADTNYLVKNEHELEKLLRVLAKEGKYSSDSNQGNEQKDLQLINQIFANNVDKYPKLQNAQNLLEDVMFFRGNDNNDDTDDSVNGDIADLLNEIQRNLADDGSYVSELRCAGNRCQDKRVSADDRDHYRDEHDRNQPNLVCIGDTCTVPESAQSRYDDKDGNLKINSKQLAKKVKISNDLDAVVLGMSDVDNLLTNFNAHKVQGVQKVKGSKLLQNIDLDRLLNNQNIENKNANVEAVVFDLTNVENGDAVANEIKKVLSHDENTPEEDYDGNLVQQHLKSASIKMLEFHSILKSRA